MATQADAYDSNGDILKVEFEINGKLVESIRKPPYLLQFTVPVQLGEHQISATAYDHAGNQKTTMLKIESREDRDTLSGDTRILQPGANASFRQGERVLIKIYVGNNDRSTLSDLYVLAKQESGLPQEIAHVSGSDNGASAYTFIWDSPPAGRYEFFLKLALDDGKLRFSKRVPIVVR
jgi:hypothetical protein